MKEDDSTGIFGKVTTPDALSLKDAYISIKTEDGIFKGFANIDSTGNYSIKGLPPAKYYSTIYRKKTKYVFFLDRPIEVIKGQQIEINYVYDSTGEREDDEYPILYMTEGEVADYCKNKRNVYAFTVCQDGEPVVKYCDRFGPLSPCMKKVVNLHEEVHKIQYTENALCKLDKDDRKTLYDDLISGFEDEAYKISDPEEEKCTGKKPPCRRVAKLLGSGVAEFSDCGPDGWALDLGTYHPDESFSVSSDLPPSVEYYRETPDGTLLLQGASDLAENLLATIKKSTVSTDINTYFPNLIEHNKVLIVPSGGLIGLDNSQAFKDNLAEFVNKGGVLLCFSQPNGYEFSALPGGLVGGYGWGEDQECHSNAVYINTYHPVLSGQGSGSINMSVDGYFTSIPDGTTVLLRRTKNNQPAMILYPYGNGYVIATTMYEDWAFGNGQSTAQGQALVRDIISWAKDPKNLQEIKPSESVNLGFEAKNKTEDKDAVQVKINILDPNRNIITTSTQPVSLLPGQNISFSTSYSSLVTSPLGIWSAEYSLLDSTGIEFQKESSGERFVISNPPSGTIPSPELSFSLQMDAESYA